VNGPTIEKVQLRIVKEHANGTARTVEQWNEDFFSQQT